MIQKLKQNKESFDFFLGSRDEERVNDKVSNHKTPLSDKSNEEVFGMIQTHEILSESDCSELKRTRKNLLLYSNENLNLHKFN